MKSKKVLALILATLMCISVFTGCGKKNTEEKDTPKDKTESTEAYHEDFISLIEEMSEIKKGELETDINVTISKNFLEMTTENLEDSEDGLSIEMGDIEDAFADLYDKDGNMKLDISAEATFNPDKEEYLINLEMFKHDFDVFVDEDTVYLEIGGIIDLIGEFSEEDISEVSSMFDDYKYLVIDSSEMDEEMFEDEDEDKDEETKDIKDYANKDNVTKKKDTYTIRLENDEMNELIDAESVLEALDKKELEDSSFTLSVTKADDEYEMDALINLENLIIVNVDITVSESSAKIDMPSEDEAISLEDIVALFMGGMEIPEMDDDYDWSEEEDVFGEIEWGEGVSPDEEDDWFGGATGTTDDEDFFGDWESKNTVEDMTITDKFNVGEGSLSFVVERKGYSVDEMSNVASDIASKMNSVINDANNGAKITSSSSSSTGEYPYNSQSFYVTHDDYNEEIIAFIEENYIDLTLNYRNLSVDDINDNLAEIANSIKSFSGVDISEEDLNSYVNELINSYDGVDDMISIRSPYEISEYMLYIYLWNGNEIDIDLTLRG